MRIAAAMALQICFGIHHTMSLGSVVTACHLMQATKKKSRTLVPEWFAFHQPLELVMRMVPNPATHSPDIGVRIEKNMKHLTHCRCFGSTGLLVR